MTNNKPSQTLLSIEGLIKSYYQRYNSLSLQLKQYKEMLQGALENDAEFHQHDQESKKSAKLKTIAKQKVLALSSNADLDSKVKDHQSQLKELRVGLSDYLTQYMSLSGTNIIESPEGEMLEIITNAKLVKKKE